MLKLKIFLCSYSIVTPRNIFYCFLFFNCFTIIGTYFILNKNEKLESFSVRYDNNMFCDIERNNETEYGKICFIKLEITKNINLPILVYYKLTNFHQNYKSYLFSVSNSQLRGENSVDGCKPLENGPNGKKLYPCGLIAHSYFSDKIIASLQTKNGTIVNLVPGDKFDYNDNIKSWKKKGIAPKHIKDMIKLINNVETNAFYNEWTREGPEQKRINNYLIKKNQSNFVKIPYPNDEDLIVWMRPSTKKEFFKLYRKIESFEDLNLNRNNVKKGETFIFKIENYFRVKEFDGKKFIVISTVSSYFGTKNKYLFAFYFGFFWVTLLAIIFSFIYYLFFSRNFGDVRFLYIS